MNIVQHVYINYIIKILFLEKRKMEIVKNVIKTNLENKILCHSLKIILPKNKWKIYKQNFLIKLNNRQIKIKIKLI